MSWSSREGKRVLFAPRFPLVAGGDLGAAGSGHTRSWDTGDPCRWHSQTRLAAAGALPAPGEAANKSWCLERRICFLQQLSGTGWKCPLGAVSQRRGEGAAGFGVSLRGVSLSGAGESLVLTSLEPGSTWPCQDLFGKDFYDSGPDKVSGCPGLMEQCRRLQHRHEHPALAQQHPGGTLPFLGQINCSANELTESIPRTATWAGQHHTVRLDWM